ncbi:hypothetical protein O181_010112 [Austropuccinia psidii MF-1]|uniref:Uncharacterized protein n=1 Tax=Austropuccinia psidii MF-1 TaxID=1389203 RepID=A0A9Q3GKW9_9BASI|nr:hypothetical protein [Austropuccinia psidii MF-1]
MSAHQLSHSVEHLQCNPSTFPWSPTSNRPIMHAHKHGKNYHVVTITQQLSHSFEHLHLTPCRSISTPMLMMGGSGSELGASQESVLMHIKQCKQSKKKSNMDINSNFAPKDYENICAYIEDKNNYNQLFGKNQKKDNREELITWAAAYE